MTLKNAPPREIKRREMVVTSKLQWHVQHSNPNLLYSTTLSSHRHPTFIKKGAWRSNQETCRNTPDGISPEWTYSHNRNNPTVENSTGNAYSSQRTAMIKERNRRPKPFLKTRYRLSYKDPLKIVRHPRDENGNASFMLLLFILYSVWMKRQRN